MTLMVSPLPHQRPAARTVGSAPRWTQNPIVVPVVAQRDRARAAHRGLATMGNRGSRQRKAAAPGPAAPHATETATPVVITAPREAPLGTWESPITRRATAGVTDAWVLGLDVPT